MIVESRWKQCFSISLDLVGCFYSKKQPETGFFLLVDRVYEEEYFQSLVVVVAVTLSETGCQYDVSKAARLPLLGATFFFLHYAEQTPKEYT